MRRTDNPGGGKCHISVTPGNFRSTGPACLVTVCALNCDVFPWGAGMEQSKASVLRQKQFEVNEKETKVALLWTMISDFDNMIGQLEQQIAPEADAPGSRIRDTRHTRCLPTRRPSGVKTCLYVAKTGIRRSHRAVERYGADPQQPTLCCIVASKLDHLPSSGGCGA